MTIEDALAVLLLFILFLLGKGDGMERRYMLSAFKYDEETGRPVSMHIYKTDDLATHAERTARLMLDVNPEATLIEIFDTRTKSTSTISRLN